ncbi:hypothetical protein BDW02DRAFT_609124 [Decorospora gaudefroyi]|uniref:Uncharacterized protein n=1 Tax=Decorospora gaudefroyi TaxID=184978 RepID=A0A6A5K751_9PLEO|nr:hypothetical protein BDW02DRAFT_609124 [Decorospora gaudefroyi]
MGNGVKGPTQSKPLPVPSIALSHQFNHPPSSRAAMSQEQPPNPGQHPPPVAPRAPQHHQMAKPAPNMLPLNPTTMFAARAGGGQSFLPPMVPAVPLPGAHPDYPPLPNLRLPLPDARSTIAARRALSARLAPSTSNGGATTSGEGYSFEARAAPAISVPRSDASARSPQGLFQDRDGSMTHEKTLTCPSPASVPSGQSSSRLPSVKAPRKAPFRVEISPATSVQDDEYSPTTTEEYRPHKKQKRSVGRPRKVVAAKRARHQSPPARRGKIPITSRSRARRPIVFSSDDESDESEETQHVLPSIEISTPPPTNTGPRPQDGYIVPKELEGTRIALGPDNWKEYISLMEKLWTETITAQEFDKRARSMFRTIDEKTRKRINKLIAMKMILPRLEEVKRSAEDWVMA